LLRRRRRRIRRRKRIRRRRSGVRRRKVYSMTKRSMRWTLGATAQRRKVGFCVILKSKD
jgi:hypothetical protein